MSEFILYFILVVFVIIIFLYYEKRYSELTYVKAKNGKEYLVRNKPDKQDAANLLGEIADNLVKLVNSLQIKHSDDPRTIQVVEKFNPSVISESISGTNYTSYSVNKGEKIVFCIRSKDGDDRLEDINTMMFVAIHELAHIMTESVGHTPEFWKNMKFALERAIDLGIYVNHDYKKHPVRYCGVTISDSPLNL